MEWNEQEWEVVLVPRMRLLRFMIEQSNHQFWRNVRSSMWMRLTSLEKLKERHSSCVCDDSESKMKEIPSIATKSLRRSKQKRQNGTCLREVTKSASNGSHQPITRLLVKRSGWSREVLLSSWKFWCDWLWTHEPPGMGRYFYYYSKL